MKRRDFLLLLGASRFGWSALAQPASELRFCVRGEPKTLHPLLVADEPSETVRYLTGGTLIRFNRASQQLEPELASSWKTGKDGRTIQFELRTGLSYSDGTPFTADDVAFTIRTLMDPELHSPVGDSFRSSSKPVQVQVVGTHRVIVTFPAPVAGLERLFDQVVILSARSPQKERAVLGPFRLEEHKPGSHLLLVRNPYYWKRDAAGRPLPYLDSIRLEIQQNRELEILRFRRGQLHLINGLDPESFDRLVAELPGSAHNAGASPDSEFLWFNQVKAAPIPDHKKEWFRSRGFRRAVSALINRVDLCRVVYRGHAQPAAGPVSPANRFWFRAGLAPHAYDPAGALRLLKQEGFRRDGELLRDRRGQPVEFSVITNAGNKTRERMAAMIQQDLRQAGIRLNLVTLDFASLIDRITRSFDFEACLLGLVNDDLDPSSQMNVWLSSGSHHQWNPNQKSPETAWEAEIDRLMRAQASSIDPQQRKLHFDRVQEIVWDQAPFLYLVNKNSLCAVSPALHGAAPVALRPQTFWNVERLSLGEPRMAAMGGR